MSSQTNTYTAIYDSSGKLVALLRALNQGSSFVKIEGFSNISFVADGKIIYDDRYCYNEFHANPSDVLISDLLKELEDSNYISDCSWERSIEMSRRRVATNDADYQGRKAKAIRLLELGNSVRAVSAKTGIPKPTLYQWRRQKKIG